MILFSVLTWDNIYKLNVCHVAQYLSLINGGNINKEKVWEFKCTCELSKQSHKRKVSENLRLTLSLKPP